MQVRGTTENRNDTFLLGTQSQIQILIPFHRNHTLFLREKLQQNFKVILDSLLHLENHYPHFPNFGYIDLKVEICQRWDFFIEFEG